MLKDILKKYGIEHSDEITDEEAEEKLTEHIDALASEKDSLSQTNQELSASVEGEKADKEKLANELSETKTELASTKGKLEQVTEMYKEQFNRNPEEKTDKTEEIAKNAEADVLQMLIDVKL